MVALPQGTLRNSDPRDPRPRVLRDEAGAGPASGLSSHRMLSLWVWLQMWILTWGK